jgi:hypothetical protein
MLLILIAGVLVVVVAMLGLSMCRVATLSDRNSAVALREWIAASQLGERRVAPSDRAGEQFLFDSPGEAFRAAG